MIEFGAERVVGNNSFQLTSNYPVNPQMHTANYAVSKPNYSNINSLNLMRNLFDILRYRLFRIIVKI